MHGDCLDLMKNIDDSSVDIVLTDPPYGMVSKMEIDGWKKKNPRWDTKLPTQKMFDLINQKIRVNGNIIIFSQEPYTSELITSQHSNLPFCYRMVWNKCHFANSLICNKAPVSYFEDILVFSKKYDTNFSNPLREYSKNIKKFINKSKSLIFKEIGNQTIDHFMRNESLQFNLCTEKSYQILTKLYDIEKEEWFKTYSELKEIDINYKNKFKRHFNLWDGKKYKSNILKYKKESIRYHQTQKPVSLLDDLIKTYSNEEMTVLDFCMGSGSTGIACLNTNRKFIGIEKDDHYFNVAKNRIEQHQLDIK